MLPLCLISPSTRVCLFRDHCLLALVPPGSQIANFSAFLAHGIMRWILLVTVPLSLVVAVLAMAMRLRGLLSEQPWIASISQRRVLKEGSRP